MARDEYMAAYLFKTHTTIGDFSKLENVPIGWNLNSHADALATDLKRHISISALKSLSINKHVVCVQTITVGPCWMDPYVLYLKDETLPQDKKEAKSIRMKYPRFWLSKDLNLYKWSFSGPYLLCVHPKLIKDLMFEIHEGIYGSHTGGRSLAHRALTQGY